MLLCGGIASAAPKKPAKAKSTRVAASRPAGPTLKAISVAPTTAQLFGPKSLQRLIVTGQYSDGTLKDLSRTAKFSTSSGKVAKVDAEGVVQPVADGTTKIVAKVGNLAAASTVEVKDAGKPFNWNFRNQVQAVLSKAGCNMGACHGAAAGKNGFRLSLRAYDHEQDFERLLFESAGRRIQRTDPGNSLLLTKATLTVPHQGGRRFKPGSLDYRVIAEWIANGLPGPSKDDPTLVKIDATPGQRILAPGAQQQLLVKATYSDGHTEDVTHWARYTSNEESIATVDDGGLVTVASVGETPITIMFGDKVTTATITAPFPNKVAPSDYQKIARANYVDDLVLRKLSDLRILPSEISSDTEFIRRVYVDALGVLPTPAEVRAFMNDRSPNKRAQLIDQLLERPEFVDQWAYKWGDLLRVSRETLQDKGMWAFYSWVREQVANNRPWNELVYDVITASGSGFADGPANFYRISRTPEDLCETVSQAFLGIRVSCARCHNHPFEKWTQNDYYQMANFFSRIGRKNGDSPQDQVIYAAPGGEINHPKLGKPLPPRPFDGQEIPLAYQGDRREKLAEWMVSGENYYFTGTIVNRVWRHFMGRGLVEPVDDMRVTNPPSNAPLMAALQQDFVKNKFDLKHLMRTIMNSRTYQLTSKPNDANRKDERHYSRYFVRRLTAEQLLDGLVQVTGQAEKFAGFPMGTRALQLPDTRVGSYFLDVFGRPPRQITCDCERAQEPNMAQALHLINGAGVNQKISAAGGIVDTMVKANKTDREIVEELYLTCFSRMPTEAEMKASLSAIEEGMHPELVKPAVADPKKPAEAQAAPQPPAAPLKPAEMPVARKQVLEDLLWALINGKEFVFNH